jgi:transcriptional regulator with XRE-family HTH domain
MYCFRQSWWHIRCHERSGVVCDLEETVGDYVGKQPDRRRDVAAAFRRLRTEAGLTVADVAIRLECGPARVVQLEAGMATLGVTDARDLLDLYQVGGQTREALLGRVRAARRQSWWTSFGEMIDETLEHLLIIEDEASGLYTYQPSLIPGILQTERYARELMLTVRHRSPDLVERRVELRMARQRILNRAIPPRLTVVLDEAALRRPVGGTRVMRDQIQRLADCASWPTVSLHVLPFEAGPHQAMGFAFHVYEFTNGDPKIVQLELLDRVLMVDDADEAGHYLTAFDQALASALDTTRSRQFLLDSTLTWP